MIGGKYFCCYCLQAFSTEEILKSHTKDCFKINGEQRIQMPKKGEYVKFKNFERHKITIYDSCRFRKHKIIENNGRQSYQKHDIINKYKHNINIT